MKTVAIISLLAALTALPAAAQTRAAPEGASDHVAKPMVQADGAMIVAANPLAAAAGAEILRRGGSAADAAIAALLVLNVVEPQSSGVGGGAFALYWRAETQTLSSWDGRETAPRAADARLFLDAQGRPLPFTVAVESGRGVGAPGLVRLLEHLHRAHGRRPWSELFAPAIALARDGFEVSPRLAMLLRRFRDRLRVHPEPRAIFFRPDGEPLAAGDTLRNPALARTLEELAEHGANAFYAGRIAREIVAAAARAPRPGGLSLEDLAAYEAKPRSPLCARYRDAFDVCGMGPPSSGASTVGQLLGLFQRATDRADLPRASESVAARHAFLEASRLAYADRARYLADPDFAPTPARGLLDPGYLDARAAELSLDRASTDRAAAGVPAWRQGALRFAPDASLGRPGTTHLSVVDAHGDVLSLTASIESAFGSGRMAAGFLLNNQLTDFSFRPERDGAPVANRVEPNKRPRSSMAPTIVFERTENGQRPILALGSPGGSRIPEYVATTLIGVLDLGLDPAAAAARAHVSHRNRDAVQVETGAANDALADGLAKRGFSIERPSTTSGMHVIRILPDGRLQGGADPRREGRAIGVKKSEIAPASDR